MPRFSYRLASLVLAVAAAAMPVQAQDKVQKPSQSEMKTAMTAYFDAVNAGDVAKAQSLFSADATVEDPVGSARRPAGPFVATLVAGKANIKVLLMTGSNLNIASAAIVLSRPNGTGVNAIEMFTFNSDGKISGFTLYAGHDDRKT